MFPTNGLSNEAIAVLRACILSRDCATVDGVRFVRCGWKLGAAAYTIAAEIRTKLGCTDEQVCAAWNAVTGHDDYVRVTCDCTAWRLVCHMKS